MRHIIIILSVGLLLIGCNSAKRNQKLLSKGNYDQAIELAVKKLQRNKNAPKNDQRILLLEEAFEKAVAEDNRRIAFLKKQSDPSVSKEIYYTYQNMEYIQGQIRPLLPLYSASLGRNAKFKMVNYSDAITSAKAAYVDYLYDEAKGYMNRQTIADYRTAYNVFCELDELEPNYKDVTTLRDDAHFYGTDFVLVSLRNRSGQIIPHRLERELLDFNTYGLDNFWTQYHTERDRELDYNYGISLDFRDIRISPERVNEREERRTKRIKDGWEYKLDPKGNVVKDSLGNAIKIDKWITVSARITFTEQTKAVTVGGHVIYRDIPARRDIDKFPLATEFVFENVFARFRGDERALLPQDMHLLGKDFVPFPSNEQLVFDAGEDIKARLREILKENSLQ